MPKLSITAFCESRPNEDAHADHVTGLALRIFDDTSRALQLDPADRMLLEAAAPLHDIGYPEAPLLHASKGAAIIRENGIAGYTDEQCEAVAGIVRLHTGDYEKAMREPEMAALRDPSHILRLAAILRVADALDRSHIQDAQIMHLIHKEGVFELAVRSEWYPGNLIRANEKAELWADVFPIPLRIKAVQPGPKSSPFVGVVDMNSTALDAARRILQTQYRVIVDNRAGALAAEKPLYAVIMLDSVRRFQTTIDLLKPYLRSTSAPEVVRVLEPLEEALAPASQIQFWIDILVRPEVSKRLSKDAAWQAYCDHQEHVNSRHQQQLAVLLEDDRFQPMAQVLQNFLRTELPMMIRKKKPEKLNPYATTSLKDSLIRLRTYEKAIRRCSPGDAQEILQLARKECYWAEVLAPVVGSPTHTLAVRLRALTDALEKLTELDVHVVNLESEGLQTPRALKKTVKQMRKESHKAALKAWKELHNKTFEKRFFARVGGARKTLAGQTTT